MRQHSEKGEFTDSQLAFPPAISGLFPAARPESHTGYEVKAQQRLLCILCHFSYCGSDVTVAFANLKSQLSQNPVCDILLSNSLLLDLKVLGLVCWVFFHLKK